MAVTNEYTLKISVKQAQANVDELNKSLAAQKDLIKDLTDEVSDYEDKLGKMDSRDKNRIKKTEELIAVTKKQLTEEKAGLKAVNADRKVANTQLKEAKKNQADFGGIMGYVDKQTGGAVSGMNKFVSSIKKATKGLNLMKVAIIGTGIGALVILITSLVAAFKQSEEGQEKMQLGLAKVGAVVKQVMDLFSDLGTAIIDAVTNPMKSIKKLGNGITKFMASPWDYVKNTIKGATKAVKDFAAETNKEIDQIGKITKARQKAHHIERDLIVERAKANRKINDIRLQAEDRVNNTATERVALLRKAQKIEEGITQKEIAAKKLLVKAQIAEMAQGKNTIEEKDKLAKMQAELINLDTRKLRSQRLLQTQITTALNEEAAAKKAITDAENERLAADQKKVSDKIAEDKEIERQRLQDLEDLRRDFYTRRRLEQAASLEEEMTLRMQIAMSEIKATKDNFQLRSDMQDAWDAKIKEAREKDAANAKALDQSVLNAKLDSAAQAFAMVGAMSEKGSKLAKAMAIGQATIAGFQSVQNAFTTASLSPITTAWPAYPFIQAGLAGGFAAANIRKIAATDESGGGPKPDASPTAPTVTPPSNPANFNTVGASSTNQLADAIGGQAQKPSRAYVVSTDVTSAQSLDRNIISGATIGG
tara:strand:- start:1140 stop:3086 length:1947 start_codon:yes stop_codon:yes gene_type:complete